MKINLQNRILFLIINLIPFFSIGQSEVLKIGGKYTGSFKYEIKTASNIKISKEGQKYIFDCSAAKTKAAIALQLSQLKINNNSNEDDFKLMLKAEGLKGTKELQRVDREKDFLIPNDKLLLQFKVLKDGNGLLPLHYYLVTPAGENGKEFHPYYLKYEIKGITEKPTETLPKEEIAAPVISKEQLAFEKCSNLEYKAKIRCLQRFLLDFPNGEKQLEAIGTLQEIEDKIWATSQDSNSIAQYKVYLSIFNKKGRYQQEAHQKIKDLEEEKEAWLAAKDCENFQQFIQDFPYSFFVKEAQEAVQRNCPIEITQTTITQLWNGTRQYQLELKNAVEPEITFNPNNEKIEVTRIGLPQALEFTVPADIYPVLLMMDTIKMDELSDVEVDLKQLLHANMEKQEGNLLFQIEGGIPPYQLKLFEGETLITSTELNDINTWTTSDWKIQNYKSDWNGLLRTEITDASGNIIFNIAEQRVAEAKTSPSILPIALILLAVIVFLSFIIFIYQFLKKRKMKAVQQMMEKKKVQQPQQQPVFEPSETIPPVFQNRDLSVNTTTAPVVPVVSTEKKIKIKGINRKKSKQHLSTTQLSTLLQSHHYLALDLEQLWEDTIIKTIHFEKESISQLNQFLEEENIRKIDESEGSIPEIGGFLMGNYTQRMNGQYEVTIDKFVPIEAAFHNNYQLQFSTESLVKDLGDVQDAFPDKAVVGWFHTHPGHGLFLSKPDLAIQEGQFNKDFQFALEIDSLNADLDTAFFTRKRNGQMNNSKDLKADTWWFSWKDLCEV